MWFLQARCGLLFTIINHNHNQPIIPEFGSAFNDNLRLIKATYLCVYSESRSGVRGSTRNIRFCFQFITPYKNDIKWHLTHHSIFSWSPCTAYWSTGFHVPASRILDLLLGLLLKFLTSAPVFCTRAAHAEGTFLNNTAPPKFKSPYLK